MFVVITQNFDTCLSIEAVYGSYKSYDKALAKAREIRAVADDNKIYVGIKEIQK